jgi:hypothetical protein
MRHSRGEVMGGRRGAVLTVLFILCFLVSGCYYFSAKKDMKEATGLVSQLKGMDGAKKAPYDYTSAEKNLEISNMEFQQNDFKAAKAFAERSKSAAQSGLTQIKK